MGKLKIPMGKLKIPLGMLSTFRSTTLIDDLMFYAQKSSSRRTRPIDKVWDICVYDKLKPEVMVR